MTSLSVITAVFVLNLHYRGPDRRPVPSCLRRLLSYPQRPSFTLRPRDNDVTESPRRHDDGLHDSDWTLTMTVETLARELSCEMDHVTVISLICAAQLHMYCSRHLSSCLGLHERCKASDIQTVGPYDFFIKQIFIKHLTFGSVIRFKQPPAKVCSECFADFHRFCGFVCWTVFWVELLTKVIVVRC